MLDKLKGQVPDAVLAELPAAIAKYHITTPLRLAHFLAQCAHESAGFVRVVENLSYSAEGLKKTFPKYFTDDQCLIYSRKPSRIGARAYADRMGNGNEKSGDGYKFRGRGYLQLTGKANYIAFTQSMGVDCINNPDLVADEYPLTSAAFFFVGLWRLCDRGATDADVAAVTKRVNGGTLGLAERIRLFKKFYALLKKPS